MRHQSISSLAFITQGNREWEASLSYAAAGIWFAHNELPGSAGWCVLWWLLSNVLEELRSMNSAGLEWLLACSISRPSHSTNRCQAHSDEERMHALKIFNHLADRRIEEDERAGEGYSSVLAAKLSMLGVDEQQGKKEGKKADAVGGEKLRARQPGEGDLQKEEPPQVCMHALFDNGGIWWMRGWMD